MLFFREQTPISWDSPLSRIAKALHVPVVPCQSTVQTLQGRLLAPCEELGICWEAGTATGNSGDVLQEGSGLQISRDASLPPIIGVPKL